MTRQLPSYRAGAERDRDRETENPGRSQAFRSYRFRHIPLILTEPTGPARTQGEGAGGDGHQTVGSLRLSQRLPAMALELYVSGTIFWQMVLNDN